MVIMATKKPAKKPAKSSSKGGKKSLFKRIMKYVLYTIIGLFVFSFLLTLLYRWVNPPITYLMLSRKVSDGYEINKEWIDINKLPKHTYNMAIAAEDANFLKHNGFDFGAIEKAMKHNEKSKRKRGASTISQQVAKNVFLWPNRSWLRKGLEVYFTFLVELLWDKERIMEVYLNVAEMGKGIYGIQAASKFYFKKDASKLTASESALIFASLPSPLRSNPAKPSAYLLSRQGIIMRNYNNVRKLKLEK